MGISLFATFCFAVGPLFRTQKRLSSGNKKKWPRTPKIHTHTNAHTRQAYVFFLLFLHLCFFALLVSDSRNISFFSDQQRLIAFTTNTLRGGRGAGAVGGVSSALRLFTSRQTQKNTNRSSRTGGARITVRVHDRRKTD